MATAYLLPMKTAAALFPLLALALFLPTAVVLYRRHGVMSQGRALSLFGFLYYAITAVCMTVVPLPKRTATMCETFKPVAHPQWIPGNTFGDVWKEAHHKVTLNALVLHNPAVAGALFNLVLLLPLGVFLRYHFRRGIWTALGAGLGVSLFFELTQGTALWGVYPCPYRLFDVDDLLINTAGAVLGWVVAGPAARLLPALDTLDDRALARRPVAFGRRLVALVTDLVGVAVATVLGVAFVAYDGGADTAGVLRVPLIVFTVWFVVLPWLTGATPGKRLLLLRLVAVDGGRPAPWRLAVRAALLGAVTLPLLAAGATVLAALLYEPSPTALFHRAREAGGGGVLYLLATHLVETFLLLVVTGSLGAYALMARRRPQGLWIHDVVSGVRNEALPHARARRDAPNTARDSAPNTAPGTTRVTPPTAPSAAPPVGPAVRGEARAAGAAGPAVTPPVASAARTAGTAPRRRETSSVR